MCWLVSVLHTLEMVSTHAPHWNPSTFKGKKLPHLPSSLSTEWPDATVSLRINPPAAFQMFPAEPSSTLSYYSPVLLPQVGHSLAHHYSPSLRSSEDKENPKKEHALIWTHPCKRHDIPLFYQPAPLPHRPSACSGSHGTWLTPQMRSWAVAQAPTQQGHGLMLCSTWLDALLPPSWISSFFEPEALCIMQAVMKACRGAGNISAPGQAHITICHPAGLDPSTLA